MKLRIWNNTGDGDCHIEQDYRNVKCKSRRSTMQWKKIMFNKYVSILKTRGLPLGPAETAGEETTKGGKPWGESQVGFFEEKDR